MTGTSGNREMGNIYISITIKCDSCGKTISIPTKNVLLAMDYANNVKEWSIIKNNGNGYDVKCPSCREISVCPDCGTKIGQPHHRSCDVERCSVCGEQKIQCNCDGHDSEFAKWTGHWPGSEEAKKEGLFCKWHNQLGWISASDDDPYARPDLNKFHEMGLHKKYFVKMEMKK